jgi:mono/diheme cytochrome c family protein
MKKVVLMSLLTMTTLFFACKKGTPTVFDCTGTTPTYEKDIKAIMDKSCATSGCHDAKTAEKKIDLSNYGQVKIQAPQARFMGSIEHLSGYDAMPQKADKFSDAQIKLVSCWISNGMPEE